MTIAAVNDAVSTAFGRLWKGLELTWRLPQRAPKNPVTARPAAAWPTWDPAKPAPLAKDAQNWFYTTVVFPKTLHGLPLAGKQAYIYINGYCPFTLWLDGEEKYREQHVWYATGPLADPVVLQIEPGREYRLVLCLEPTDTPFNFSPVNVIVNPLPAVEAMWEVMTAFAELKMAEALATQSGVATELALVEQAAAVLDLAALAKDHWPTFLASVAAMERKLQPFAAAAKEHTTHLIGHTHIDMDWQWSWKDTLSCIRRDFHSVLQLMDDDPRVTFSLSQIPSYAAVKEHDPANFARVQEYIRSGRWENLAATWVEGDLNMADGESLARQLEYAAAWSASNLGAAAAVFWAPDTFGHPGNMPQIAHLGECPTYFHWRCNPGGPQNWPARMWEGVDGSQVLAVSSAYGGGLLPGPWEFFSTHSMLDAIRCGLKTSHYVWGLGDHGGGLPRHQLALFDRVKDRPLLPTYRFSTVRELREALLAEGDRLPQNRGETHTLFEGCYTSHALIKVYNRRCENALLTAEALSALAGLDRNGELRDAWTPILFSQFHDIYCGCAVPASYQDAYARAESALAVAATVTKAATAKLVGKPPRTPTSLALLNPLGFATGGALELELPPKVVALADADGRCLPVQRVAEGKALVVTAGVPAFSRQELRLLSRTATPPAVTAEIKDEGYYLHLETPQVSCRIAKNSGVIGSYFDKRLQRELVAYGVPRTLQHVQNSRADMGLGVFQLLDEAENPMAAWLINDILRQENLLRGATVTVLDNGPVCVRLQVVHQVRSSQITTELRFYRELPQVEFLITVDWAEPGGPGKGVPHLKLAFAANLTAPRVHAEGPYTIREVPANGVEQVTQKWVDITGDEFGFTVLNDSRYGYDASGGCLRVSLLRNSYNPDPDSDRGRHQFRVAILPHGPTFDPAACWRQGMAYNRPPVPVLAAAKGELRRHEPWLSLSGSASVVCSALRASATAADTVLLRLFETSGAPAAVTVRLPPGFRSAQEVNFLEHALAPAVTPVANTVTLGFRPYEIKTLCLNPTR